MNREKPGIVVGGHEIEVAIQLAHINEIGSAHVVRGDEVRGAQLSQHRQLLLKERGIGSTLVAVIVQRQPGVRWSTGGKRHRDLRKIAVSVAPKYGAPRLIEGVERWILAPQPLLESFPAGTAVAPGTFAEGEFVVDLPTD